jgi:two-component system response regulator AlgR
MQPEHKITILIVDDEKLARERLKRLIAGLTEYSCIGEAENGEQALQRIQNLSPDIVILDVRMPIKDGMELARQLSIMEFPPAVIFCTAFDEYAIKAFQVSATGYLLKPVRHEDLVAALAKASQVNQLQVRQLESAQEGDDDMFVAHTWQGHELIPFDNIYYFRADQKYLTICHKHGETLSDQTLKELEQTWGERVVRVHRNALINVRHIDALCKTADGKYSIRIRKTLEKVPVSRRLVSDIKAFLERR